MRGVGVRLCPVLRMLVRCKGGKDGRIWKDPLWNMENMANADDASSTKQRCNFNRSYGAASIWKDATGAMKRFHLFSLWAYS